jgi:predicted Rdx family selenoprotein
MSSIRCTVVQNKWQSTEWAVSAVQLYKTSGKAQNELYTLYSCTKHVAKHRMSSIRCTVVQNMWQSTEWAKNLLNTSNKNIKNFPLVASKMPLFRHFVTGSDEWERNDVPGESTFLILSSVKWGALHSETLLEPFKKSISKGRHSEHRGSRTPDFTCVCYLTYWSWGKVIEARYKYI